MSGRLRSHVHVRDATGVPHVYGPDDEIPDWAARRITNPRAWDEPPRLDDEPADEPARKSVGARPAQTASKETWASYAAAIGIELPAAVTKAEIIEAVREAETADHGENP